MNIGVVAKNDIIMQSAIDLIKNISEKYGCILYFMHENYDGKCKNVIPESEFFDKIASENISACLTYTPDRVIYIGDNTKLMKKHQANTVDLTMALNLSTHV